MSIVDQSELWGTGYSDKRHLIREGSRKPLLGRALCRKDITLVYFGDRVRNRLGAWSEQEIVMSRKPCGACLRKAGIKHSFGCSLLDPDRNSVDRCDCGG